MTPDHDDAGSNPVLPAIFIVIKMKKLFNVIKKVWLSKTFHKCHPNYSIAKPEFITFIIQISPSKEISYWRCEIIKQNILSLLSVITHNYPDTNFVECDLKWNGFLIISCWSDQWGEILDYLSSDYRLSWMRDCFYQEENERGYVNV